MEHTYTWICNVIESCNNDFHFDCVDVVISLYKIKYGNEDDVTELRVLRQNKWNAVHSILI